MGFVFAYCSAAVALIIIWFMPKHLSHKEIYITWGWMAALTLYTDVSFGVVLDLYDFVESKVDFIDLPLQALLPPSIGIILLNFMPQRRMHFIYYLVGVLLFSLFFEWLSLLTGYLVFKGWKLWYSFPFYLIGMIFLRWHLFYLRKK